MSNYETLRKKWAKNGFILPPLPEESALAKSLFKKLDSLDNLDTEATRMRKKLVRTEEQRGIISHETKQGYFVWSGGAAAHKKLQEQAEDISRRAADAEKAVLAELNAARAAIPGEVAKLEENSKAATKKKEEEKKKANNDAAILAATKESEKIDAELKQMKAFQEDLAKGDQKGQKSEIHQNIEDFARDRLRTGNDPESLAQAAEKADITEWAKGGNKRDVTGGAVKGSSTYKVGSKTYTLDFEDSRQGTKFTLSRVHMIKAWKSGNKNSEYFGDKHRRERAKAIVHKALKEGNRTYTMPANYKTEDHPSVKRWHQLSMLAISDETRAQANKELRLAREGKPSESYFPSLDPMTGKPKEAFRGYFATIEGPLRDMDELPKRQWTSGYKRRFNHLERVHNEIGSINLKLAGEKRKALRKLAITRNLPSLAPLAPTQDLVTAIKSAADSTRNEIAKALDNTPNNYKNKHASAKALNELIAVRDSAQEACAFAQSELQHVREEFERQKGILPANHQDLVQLEIDIEEAAKKLDDAYLALTRANTVIATMRRPLSASAQNKMRDAIIPNKDLLNILAKVVATNDDSLTTLAKIIADAEDLEPADYDDRVKKLKEIIQKADVTSITLINQAFRLSPTDVMNVLNNAHYAIVSRTVPNFEEHIIDLVDTVDNASANLVSFNENTVGAAVGVLLDRANVASARAVVVHDENVTRAAVSVLESAGHETNTAKVLLHHEGYHRIAENNPSLLAILKINEDARHVVADDNESVLAVLKTSEAGRRILANDRDSFAAVMRASEKGRTVLANDVASFKAILSASKEGRAAIASLVEGTVDQTPEDQDRLVIEFLKNASDAEIIALGEPARIKATNASFAAPFDSASDDTIAIALITENTLTDIRARATDAAIDDSAVNAIKVVENVRSLNAPAGHGRDILRRVAHQFFINPNPAEAGVAVMGITVAARQGATAASLQPAHAVNTITAVRNANAKHLTNALTGALQHNNGAAFDVVDDAGPGQTRSTMLKQSLFAVDSNQIKGGAINSLKNNSTHRNVYRKILGDTVKLKDLGVQRKINHVLALRTPASIAANNTITALANIVAVDEATQNALADILERADVDAQLKDLALTDARRAEILNPASRATRMTVLKNEIKLRPAETLKSAIASSLIAAVAVLDKLYATIQESDDYLAILLNNHNEAKKVICNLNDPVIAAGTVITAEHIDKARKRDPEAFQAAVNVALAVANPEFILTAIDEHPEAKAAVEAQNKRAIADAKEKTPVDADAPDFASSMKALKTVSVTASPALALAAKRITSALNELHSKAAADDTNPGNRNMLVAIAVAHPAAIDGLALIFADFPAPARVGAVRDAEIAAAKDRFRNPSEVITAFEEAAELDSDRVRAVMRSLVIPTPVVGAADEDIVKAAARIAIEKNPIGALKNAKALNSNAVADAIKNTIPKGVTPSTDPLLEIENSANVVATRNRLLGNNPAVKVAQAAQNKVYSDILRNTEKSFINKDPAVIEARKNALSQPHLVASNFAYFCRIFPELKTTTTAKEINNNSAAALKKITDFLNDPYRRTRVDEEKKSNPRLTDNVPEVAGAIKRVDPKLAQAEVARIHALAISSVFINDIAAIRGKLPTASEADIVAAYVNQHGGDIDIIVNAVRCLDVDTALKAAQAEAVNQLIPQDKEKYDAALTTAAASVFEAAKTNEAANVLRDYVLESKDKTLTVIPGGVCVTLADGQQVNVTAEEVREGVKNAVTYVNSKLARIIAHNKETTQQIQQDIESKYSNGIKLNDAFIESTEIERDSAEVGKELQKVLESFANPKTGLPDPKTILGRFLIVDPKELEAAKKDVTEKTELITKRKTDEEKSRVVAKARLTADSARDPIKKALQKNSAASEVIEKIAGQIAPPANPATLDALAKILVDAAPPAADPDAALRSAKIRLGRGNATVLREVIAANPLKAMNTLNAFYAASNPLDPARNPDAIMRVIAAQGIGILAIDNARKVARHNELTRVINADQAVDDARVAAKDRLQTANPGRVITAAEVDLQHDVKRAIANTEYSLFKGNTKVDSAREAAKQRLVELDSAVIVARNAANAAPKDPNLQRALSEARAAVVVPLADIERQIEVVTAVNGALDASKEVETAWKRVLDNDPAVKKSAEAHNTAKTDLVTATDKVSKLETISGGGAASLATHKTALDEQAKTSKEQIKRLPERMADRRAYIDISSKLLNPSTWRLFGKT